MTYSGAGALYAKEPCGITVLQALFQFSMSAFAPPSQCLCGDEMSTIGEEFALGNNRYSSTSARSIRPNVTVETRESYPVFSEMP